MPRVNKQDEGSAPTINVRILEQAGVLSTSKRGWTTELNLVSWNGRPAKYEIRTWSPDHTQMGKGATFTLDELHTLYKLLSQWNWNQIAKTALRIGIPHPTGESEEGGEDSE